MNREPLSTGQVSLTEDSRRCMLHVFKSFAELQKSRLLFQALASTHVILPLQIMSLAQAIYVSVTERREIALAMMEGLALTSNHLCATGNPLAVLASYLHAIATDWLGGNLLSLLFDGEYAADDPDPNLLAFACVVVALDYQLPVTPSLPERQWLQFPLSVSQLFVKARRYWSLLVNIALPAKATHWRAPGGTAQLPYVPKGNPRGATGDTAVNEASHPPQALARYREDPPCAPAFGQQVWVRKCVSAAGMCREGAREENALTAVCSSSPKRGVDASVSSLQGYVTLSGALERLLTAAVGLAIPSRGSWPQRMLLLGGVSLSATGAHADPRLDPTLYTLDYTDAMPDQTKDVMPDQTTDVMLDQTTDVTPDQTTDVLPDQTTDVTPDAPRQPTQFFRVDAPQVAATEVAVTPAPSRNSTRQQWLDYPLQPAQLNNFEEISNVPILADFIDKHMPRDFYNRIFHPIMMEALSHEEATGAEPLLLGTLLQRIYWQLLREIRGLHASNIASTQEVRQYLLQLHSLYRIMRHEWKDVIATAPLGRFQLRNILAQYLSGPMALTAFHDKYQIELTRLVPGALYCELEIFMQNEIGGIVEQSPILSTLFFHSSSWLMTLYNAQQPPDPSIARALFHTAEWLYIALQKLRQDLSAKHRQLPEFYNLSQHEIYRRLTGNPHLLDFDLRFAAILVYLQVLPTLEYVKSHGTSGNPIIAPERLDTLFLDLRYPLRLTDVKATLGECVPAVTVSADVPPPANAQGSCRPTAPLACTAPTAWLGRRVIEEISPAQVIQGVMMYHCLSDKARTYNRTIGLRSVLAARADAVLGIKGPRGAWLVVDAGIRLPPVFWLGIASGLTLAQLDAACAIASDDAPACTGQVFNNGGGFNGNSGHFFYLGNMSSAVEKMTGATGLSAAQTQGRQPAMLNAQAMAREPHIQKVTFYEPLLGAENDKVLLRRLSPQGIKAEPYEFSEARKFTGLQLEGTKARLRQLQRRIEVDEAAFKAFISLFLSTVDDRELARTVASFNDVLRRACDFIDNITRLNYTNIAMVGTDDGNRTAISSALSPTMLKKTPLFYAAQDAYVKGLVVITDPLVKLLHCHDCPDVKNRTSMANDELLKQIILLSSPVNRFITLQHDVSAPVPKICSTDPKDVLTPLQVHFSYGLMTELTQYAARHRLPPPKEQDVNDFIHLHVELKSALMMNSADWLMLIIRDYSSGQRACRDWHIVPHRCADAPC